MASRKVFRHFLHANFLMFILIELCNNKVTVTVTVTQLSLNVALRDTPKTAAEETISLPVISKNSKLYLIWFILMQGSPGPVGAPGLPGSTGNPVSCIYSAVLMAFFTRQHM